MRFFKKLSALVVLLLLVGCGSGPDDVTSGNNIGQSQSQHASRTAMIELKSALQENPENLNARRQLGELYLRLGDGASAEKELMRVHRPGDDGAEIALLLSRALILKNELDKALKWTKLPEGAKAEQQAEAAFVSGEISVALGDKKSALEAYDHAIKVHPESEWALLARVKILVVEKNLEQAAREMAHALNQYPGSIEGWLLQGDINSGLANYSAAEESYLAALGATGTEEHTRFGLQARLGIIQARLAQSDSAGASKYIDTLLAQLPNHPLPKYFDALRAFQQKQYEKTEERLSQVLRIAEGHLPSHLLMGAAQFALEKYEQANLHLTRFVNAMPGHLPARKMLAAVHMRLQSPKQAFEVLEPVVDDDENTNVELLSMVGLAALSAGDVASGERYLSRALKQGESAAIRGELAKIYLAKGEYDEAIKELEMVSGDEALKARMMIALAYLKKGSVERAKTAARKLLKEYPEEAVVDSLMGGIYLSQGERGKAKASYRESLSKDKLFVPALLQLAKLGYEDGDLVEAEEYFKQVLIVEDNNLSAFFGLAQIAEHRSNQEKALEWIDRARTANPGSVEPVLVLARYYIKSKQLGKAADIVRDGIKANPDHALLNRLDAKIKFDQGNRLEAINVLRRSTERNPQDVSNVIALAAMQRELGQEEQARQSLLKGLKTVPDAMKMKLEIELVALDIENASFGTAKKRIESLKDRGKDLAVVYALEGRLNMAQNKLPDAVAAFQQAYELNSSFRFFSELMQAKYRAGIRDEIDQDVAKWFSLGAPNSTSEDKIASVYMNLGDNNKAIQYLEMAIERNADHVPALNNLAWLYSLQNDSRSISFARKAYALAPRSSAVIDTLGWVLVTDGQHKEGIERLREAYQMDKENDDIVIHLVEALIKSGSGSGEAKKLLREVLMRSPQAKERSDVQRLSSQLAL